MSKQFYFSFGNGSPASYTGLSPSLTVFLWNGITALIGPICSELSAGTGIYGFNYGTTASIAFVIDGGATLLQSSIRYIVGSIDPVMAVDQSVGYGTDSFGSTSLDPSTIFGQVKRAQEFNEGNKLFIKSTGLWDISSRGSSILLREKALTNTVTSAGST